MKFLWAVLCVVGLTSVSQAGETLLSGPLVKMGNGNVKSFVGIDTQYAVPTVMGYWLEAKALENLPEHETVFDVPLPKDVKVAPFDHLTVDWNPHGHIPTSVYDVPHFDFHFYFVSADDLNKITCAEADLAPCMKQPDSEKVPPNYVGTPEGVPKMGWHWVDLTSPEFNGQPFTSTFIYGYYGGEITFIEPMVTLSILTNSVSIEKDIPQPKKFSKAGFYPKKYSVEYHAPGDAYLISLKDFALHN